LLNFFFNDNTGTNFGEFVDVLGVIGFALELNDFGVKTSGELSPEFDPERGIRDSESLYTTVGLLLRVCRVAKLISEISASRAVADESLTVALNGGFFDACIQNIKHFYSPPRVRWVELVNNCS